MSQESRQAEKDYLARTGSSEWERAKPFSQRGADTLEQSARLLQDFAVAVAALNPATDDLVLDLGAGGGWCSDLLRKLNRRSVAVDLSLEMLRTARSRPSGDEIPAVAADMEALPFRTGSFQRAICLNAIHHVPNIPAAVSEISRVLTRDGVAVFMEPGRGHSEATISTTAMREFGVLEQDVLIADFSDACRKAGFRDVRINTLAYAIPGFELTPEQWTRWARSVAVKRPLRALRKIVRATAEIFGIGKGTFLFDEAFSMSVLRALRHASEDHPMIVAAKSESSTGRSPVVRAAAIEIEMAGEFAKGAWMPGRATLTNRGSARWRARSSSGIDYVALGVQVVDEGGRLLIREYHRVPLTRDVAPGESLTVTFECPPLESPGTYGLKFDMVAEGVTWFEAVGSTTVTQRVTVI